MPIPPKKRHFMDIIVEDDEIDASVRTYRVPEHKANAIMQLMDEYLIERVPTGRRPAYEDDPPPEEFTNPTDESIFGPVPEGYTKVKGGALLLMARELAGVTQLELSRELRVSQADLSKMETGKRPIGKRLARKFGHRFNINYRDFL